MFFLVSCYSWGLRNLYTSHYSIALIVVIITNMYGVYVVA